MTYWCLPLVQCPYTPTTAAAPQATLDDPPVHSPLVQHPCMHANGHTSAKINISYSILFNLTTSYSSYFEGKKGISRNKTSFFLLMWGVHPSEFSTVPHYMCSPMAAASQATLDCPPALALGPAPPCAPKDKMNTATTMTATTMTATTTMVTTTTAMRQHVSFVPLPLTAHPLSCPTHPSLP